MTDLPWWSKAGVGAVGGLALALLKLIDAKFYLSTWPSIEAYAAYLTYFCYMLLGSAAAVFLADHELPSQKVRRSAFVLGLLAPSVLLAIANQPFKSAPAEQLPSAKIPWLGLIPLPAANAQGASDPAGTGLRLVEKPRISLIPKSAQELTFYEAFAAALGRTVSHDQYLVIVGATESREKALATVNDIQVLFKASGTSVGASDPRVFKVEGSTKYVVTIGGTATLQAATAVKASASTRAIGGLTNSQVSVLSVDQRKDLTNAVVNAPIISTRNLSSAF